MRTRWWLPATKRQKDCCADGGAGVVAVLPYELLGRQERRPKTEEKSAAPPDIVFQSLFYGFVVAEQKQHRPGDPIHEKSSADEDDESRHR